MPATASDSYDIWTKQPLIFASLEAGRVALKDERLLEGFFQAWIGVCDAVDAAKLISCSTAPARELPMHGVNVLMVGEAGAGKSTLVKVMTGDDDIVTSATHAGTHGDTRYRSACKVNWIDTPGFKLPVSPEEATNTAHTQGTLTKWKDSFIWARWLARIKSMMTSTDLSVRPSAVLYCHRASSRIIPERLMDIWRIPHSYQVPLIVCLTDVCGVDDSALKEVRKSLDKLLQELGENDVGVAGQLIEINSEQKTVRGHQYKVTGVKQLLEAVINSLNPNHCLQLLTRPWFGGKTKKGKASGGQAHQEIANPFAGAEEEEEDEEEENPRSNGAGGGKRKSAAGGGAGGASGSGKKRRKSA